MYKLILAGALTVIASILVYLLDKKTKFGKIKNIPKQLIIGVIFGCCGVFATELGVNVGGAATNVRDAAPICAGLLFGPVSGIVAGVIAGVERWFAIYWGAGVYTRIACSVSTIVAGFFVAIIRKYLFANKRPTWAYGIAVSLIVEVFHMLMIFFTNVGDMVTAFSFVQKCSLPMIVANSVIVVIAIISVSILAKDRESFTNKERDLSRSFQRWLLLCVSIAFLATSFLTFSVQSRIVVSEASSTLKINLQSVADEVKNSPQGVDGVVSHSSSWHVGKNGGVIICDENGVIVSQNHKGTSLLNSDMFAQSKNIKRNECFKTKVNGYSCYCMYTKYDNNFYIAYMPVSEAVFFRDVSIYITIFIEILIFTSLSILMYILIKKLIVENLDKVNSSLAKITSGNLNETVDVRTHKEFASLSDDINSTVTALKHYISEAETRIDKELEFAKTIQHSALPSVFPPFPNRKDFDIFATMDTAKEVGGDFYDFYFVSENKLAILIADVSGKGIPAAMFMMTSKSIIKSFAETGMPVAQVFNCANKKLCENNEADMFVTAWMGIIDLETGIVDYVNAGHNPPIIVDENGDFVYLKCRAGLVLAAMDTVNYRSQQIKLNEGDKIYLYTDGVTEATDGNNQLYGEDRLIKLMNNNKGIGAEKICYAVKNDVDKFVGDVPQFDDITMLAFKFNERTTRWSKMKELSISATVENIETVTDFVNEQLEELGCSMKIQMQIDIAIDELFGNIAHYAYNPEVGSATVKVEVVKEPLSVVITFVDHGVAYDPLAKDDPDTKLSIEDREIGGLGIYMVKKTMDDISYEYKDGQNILTIKKAL